MGTMARGERRAQDEEMEIERTDGRGGTLWKDRARHVRKGKGVYSPMERRARASF